MSKNTKSFESEAGPIAFAGSDSTEFLAYLRMVHLLAAPRKEAWVGHERIDGIKCAKRQKHGARKLEGYYDQRLDGASAKSCENT